MKVKKNVKLMEFDTPNINGRIYPKFVVENAIQNFSKDDKIFGEFGTKDESCSIRLENVSHYCNNIHIDDEGLYGDVTVLDTPYGKLVQNILESGTSLDIAPRCAVEVDESKTVKYLNIFSFDIVSQSAFKNCNIQ